jgi:hypothetical protein
MTGKAVEQPSLSIQQGYPRVEVGSSPADIFCLGKHAECACFRKALHTGCCNPGERTLRHTSGCLSHSHSHPHGLRADCRSLDS